MAALHYRGISGYLRGNHERFRELVRFNPYQDRLLLRANMLGGTHRSESAQSIRMVGFPSSVSNDDIFDDYDQYVPEHIPPVGEFLEDHDVLTGDDHIAFHRLTRTLFEERKVYDMTFNYNLARLNLDTRHRNAGYRYAVQRDDSAVLRAEFTPTTPFCPQTHTLTIGSFRAWNGLGDRHEYDLIRVRSAAMHHQSEAINDQLAELEAEFRETGTVPREPNSGRTIGSNPMERAKEGEGPSRGPQAPF